jgi:hypothetical protein
MIRVPARVRSLVRIVAVCSVASVVLASCAPATTPKVIPRVNGLPAISISVPLSIVACTTSNSCVTLGTSDLDVNPTSVGEYRPANGHWTAVTVPSADTSTYVQAASCWTNGCLFVGSQSNGDLVWRYDATSHSFTTEVGPTGASGIEVVSCYASMACAVFDEAKSGPRFLTTDDAGATWSTPVSVGVPTQDTVTSLSCPSALDCIASFLNASNGIEVYASTDGGATWNLRTGVSTVTWSTLTSLNCTGKKCLGLADLHTGWRIERTNNFGRSWKKVASLPSSILDLACTSLQRCVVGGMTNSLASTPWLATVISGTVETAKLTYVPSPIADVACGSKICAAIGVTTVMTLRP